MAHFSRALRRRAGDYRFLPVHLYSNDKAKVFDHATAVPVSRSQSDWVDYLRADYEFRLGLALQANKTVTSLAEAACEMDGPVLWLEQCYVWSALRPLLGRRRRVPLVYSSYNVESQMKSAILARGDRAVRDYLPRLIEDEHDLARQADVVIACSEGDADYWESAGARRVVLIPNAADQPSPTVDAATVQRLEQRLALRFGRELVVGFISSDHEPNWPGVRDLLLPAMERLHSRMPSARLVMMGSVCRRMTSTDVPWLRMLPSVDDADKDTVLQLADLVVLPITAGGGTNLKTAEALLTTQPIVGAPVAFRGYEPSLSMHHVRTASDAIAFSEQMAELLRSSSRNMSPLVRLLTVVNDEPKSMHAFENGTWSAWYERIGDVYTDLATR